MGVLLCYWSQIHRLKPFSHLTVTGTTGVCHHISHSYTWVLNLTDPISQACHKDLRGKKMHVKHAFSLATLQNHLRPSGNVKFKLDHITPSWRLSSKSPPPWAPLRAHTQRYKGHSRDVWELEASSNKPLSCMTMAWRLQTHYSDSSQFTGTWTGLFCILFYPQKLSYSLIQSKHLNKGLMLALLCDQGSQSP